MVNTYYEVYKTSSDYSQLLYRYPFIEVNVKKELMKIPTFYFTIPRDPQMELDAPAVGDKIKIFRNYGEILRGTILKMEIREETYYFEGTSSADEWNFISETKFLWNNGTTLKAIVDEMCMRIGTGWSTQSAGFVSKNINKYEYNFTPFYEELVALADRTDTEFLFDEINKKIIFQAQVGTDKSADIRFKRGVNLESISVKKEQDETWDKVIAIGAGEGPNQLRVVVGTGNKVKVFTDKEIKDRDDLTQFAQKKLNEGNKPLYVTYEAEIEPPLFNFDIGDTVWIEDDKNKINEPMRIMEYSLTFNETETIDIVFANKKKSLTDYFKKMEKGIRTLANVHHSSAVQKGAMIQVDQDNNPILLTVSNSTLVNSTTGNTIGAIENNVTTAQNIATSAQTSATNAQTTANTALTQANTATTKADTVLNAKPNLVKRGYDSFEQIPVGTVFFGWDSNGTKQVDSTYALDGKNSLKIVGNQTGVNNYVYLGNDSADYHIPITAGKTYIASAYAFTDSASPVEVRIVVRTSDGAWFYGTPMSITKTDGWTKQVVKFTAPAGVTACILRADTRTASIPVWFDCFKLEEVDPSVNDPTPWTPASIVNIDATNITTGYLSFDRAKGGTLTLGGQANQNGKFYLYNANGETIAEMDGDTNIFAIDTLRVGEIESDSVLSANYKDKTIEVNLATGDDEGDGTTSAPYKSITRALQDVPKYNDAVVNININGNGTETVVITGYLGQGEINLNFNNNVLNGQIVVHSCTMRVSMSNGTINYSGDGAYGCVNIYKSMYVFMNNMKFLARNVANYGVMVNDHSFGYCFQCYFSGSKNEAMRAGYMGQLLAINNTGTAGGHAHKATNGGVVAGYGSCPTPGTGAQNAFADNGGETRGSWSVNSGTPPSTPPAPDTVSTWNSSSARSYRTGYATGWRSDADARQGQWNGYGLHTGCWFFGDAPAQAVTGKTVKKIRVYLTRKSSGGNSGPVTVYIRYHNHASQPGTAPVVSSAYKTASFSWGQSKWVEITDTAFLNAFANGQARGIAIYTSNSTNSYYAIFDDSAKLEITYA